MYGCLLLLALAISPSAPQQQTKTVEQRIVALGDVLTSNQILITENQSAHTSGLNLVLAEAEKVKALNEQLLVDFAVLVQTVKEAQNVTSQIVIDLQVLKGRQAVAGAI